MKFVIFTLLFAIAIVNAGPIDTDIPDTGAVVDLVDTAANTAEGATDDVTNLADGAVQGASSTGQGLTENIGNTVQAATGDPNSLDSGLLTPVVYLVDELIKDAGTLLTVKALGGTLNNGVGDITQSTNGGLGL